MGQFAHLAPQEMWDALSPVGVFTAGFNVGGNPAATIPAGRTSSGLPIGAQIVGQRNADALVMRLARQVEREMGGFAAVLGS